MTDTNLARPETGVGVVSGNAGEVAQLSRDVQLVMDRVIATGRYSSVNPFLVQAMNADSLEAATRIEDVIQGKEHLNEVMTYLDVVFLDSDPTLESDLPIYAVCTVARPLEGGIVQKMSVGAGHVVGVLIRAAEMGWFPFDAELVSVKLDGTRKAINLQVAPRQADKPAEF